MIRYEELSASCEYFVQAHDRRCRGHIDAYRNTRARVWSQHVTARRVVSHSHRESETVMTGTSEPPLFKDGREPLFSIKNSSDSSFLLGNPSQLALHACDEQIAFHRRLLDSSSQREHKLCASPRTVSLLMISDALTSRE